MDREPTGGPDAQPFAFEAFVGRRLADRYVVTALLGAGGMGAVFAARDERLHRDVAVKVVRPVLAADATAVARFVREARAAAGLAHPAIVTIFDAGWTGDVPFLVMEKLTGVSLSDRLRAGDLAQEQAVRIAVRVLDALGVAHANGIVHRDIKPANVFLCAPGGEPKLVDFGVASVTEREPGAAPLTGTDTIVGTPLYVAPEHFRGAAAAPADDLYAVGAVLYEALARRPIYVPRNMAELVALKLMEDPPPLASVAPHVPAPLAAVVDRALTRAPEARYATAGEMRAALLGSIGAADSSQDAITDPIAATMLATPVRGTGPAQATPAAVVTAPPTPTPAPVQTSVATADTRRSSGGGIALAVGVVVLALAAGGIAWWQYGRTDARATVTTPRPTTQPVVQPPPLVEPRLGLQTLADYHDASGSRRALLSTTDVWESAAADFEHAAGQRGAPVRWRTGKLFCSGRAATIRGDLAPAVTSLREAVALEPDWAPAHLAYADALAKSDDHVTALAELRRAQQLEPAWWVPLQVTGSMFASSGDYAEAVGAYRRALALAPHEPAVLDGLALSLAASGNSEQAVVTARDAIARDADSPWAHVVLAEHALETNDGATALTEASQAASILPGSASPELARGDALVLLHRNDDARDAYERALHLADTTHQLGLPGARITEVRDALARHRLPGPRFAHHDDDERTAAPSHTGAGGGGHTSSSDDPLSGLDGL